jgi:hypothetical protein
MEKMVAKTSATVEASLPNGCPFQMSATAPITIASARLAIMTNASTRITFARDITIRPSRRERGAEQNLDLSYYQKALAGL